MNRNPLINKLFIVLIGLFSVIAQQAIAAPMTAAEQVQVYASRATGSLLLLRGEGFQESHMTRLEQDITDLEAAAQMP